jgi:hypothetical protein
VTFTFFYEMHLIFLNLENFKIVNSVNLFDVKIENAIIQDDFS